MNNLIDAETRLSRKNKCQAVQVEETCNFFLNIGCGSLSVLSYSCGDGIWDLLVSNQFSEKVSEIVATDVVPCAISESAKAKIRSRTNFQFCQITKDSKLPFDDEQFDIIIHHDVIEHTRKPYLMMMEQYRCLRKSGSIFFSTPNIFRFANLIKLSLGHLRFPTVIGFNDEIGEYVHEKEFFMEDLRILMEEIGFYEVEVYTRLFGFMPFQMLFNFKRGSRFFSQVGHIIFCKGKK